MTFFPAYLVGTQSQIADYFNSLILPENTPILTDNLKHLFLKIQ